MKRLLMVAYYFPPLGAVSSLRAAKLASHLPEFGWDVRVLAPRLGTYYRDASLAFPEERVVRTGSLELSRFGKKLVDPTAGDSEPARVGPASARLRELARRLLYRPDAQAGWYPLAVSAGRRMLRDERFDAVFSSSVPFTAHRVALRLQRDFQLPWVAEFRDPWADALDPGHPARPRRLAEEKLVLDAARAVVTVSPDWVRLFRAKGAREVALVTNGFDPQDLPKTRRPHGIVLAHVGNFYPDRQDLADLWPALRDLRGAAGAGLRLRFIGPLHPVLADEIRAQGLESLVEVTGFLPHRQAVAELVGSTGLIVAGARDERSRLRGMIPAKIFEYLASGLPILYLGSPASDAAGILAGQPACHVVASGDRAATREALRVMIAQGTVERDVARYTHRALAAELAAALDRASR
jgi:glycosyltransferase involved in cell wall biosynthesis